MKNDTTIQDTAPLPSSLACLQRPWTANRPAIARRRNVTFNLLPDRGFLTVALSGLLRPAASLITVLHRLPGWSAIAGRASTHSHAFPARSSIPISIDRPPSPYQRDAPCRSLRNRPLHG